MKPRHYRTTLIPQARHHGPWYSKSSPDLMKKKKLCCLFVAGIFHITLYSQRKKQNSVQHAC